MKHYKSTDKMNKKWTQEPGYRRNILLPFGMESYADIQIQLTEISAGEKVRNHYHLKQTEFIYFLKGTCAFSFEDNSITIRHGDLLIIEPREKHSAINKGEVTARFLTFKIRGLPDDTVWDDLLL